MLAPTNLPVTQPAPKFHDVVILTKRTYACARVEPVPPEEFGIARNAKCIRDCGYCYHEVPKTQADLIGQGYDPDQIKKLPTYSVVNQSIEGVARDTVDENQSAGGDDGINKAMRLICVTEHYVRMDYEDRGRTSLYRVTTGGEGEVLRRKLDDESDYEDEIVEIDEIPFAAMTPVIMTHRFFGRSIADLVMDIQRIKTALLRGALDNLYLHNNARVEVSESHMSDNTLDDLLVSRPGGIVRTKAPGGLQWQVVPDITASVYPALQYFDATREWRTGVSRQGQGVDPNALQNQVATIANQMFNAAQAKVKLIARIFAETGIKDLFSLLHGVIRKNGSQAQTVRLRNKWVNVDPRGWKERDDMTVNVGLGTGSKEQQLQQIQLLIGAQEKAIAIGLVSKKNLYNSAKELVKLMGRKDPDAFFTPPGQPQRQQSGQPPDPDSEPIQPPPDPKLQIEQMKVQSTAEIEKMKAEKSGQIEMMKAQNAMADLQARGEIEKLQAHADVTVMQQKIAAEISLAERKFELERELKLLDAGLKTQDRMQSMQERKADHEMNKEEAAAEPAK